MNEKKMSHDAKKKMKSKGSSSSICIVLVLFLGASACAVTEVQEGELGTAQATSSNSLQAVETASSAITWWEWRLNRCGKNTNCGSQVNFDEGFWDKRLCSCQSSACGAWSCGPWQSGGTSCGCSNHP